jgi:hypothetical protein
MGNALLTYLPSFKIQMFGTLKIPYTETILTYVDIN